MSMRLPCPVCGQLNYSTDPVCLGCGADMRRLAKRPKEPLQDAPTGRQPYRPSHTLFYVAYAAGLLAGWLLVKIVRNLATWPAHASSERYLGLVGLCAAVLLLTVVAGVVLCQRGPKGQLLRSSADALAMMEELWWWFAVSALGIIIGLYAILVAPSSFDYGGYFLVVLFSFCFMFGILACLFRADRGKDYTAPEWYDRGRPVGDATWRIIKAFLWLLGLLLFLVIGTAIDRAWHSGWLVRPR